MIVDEATELIVSLKRNFILAIPEGQRYSGMFLKEYNYFIPKNKLYAKIYCKSSKESNFDIGETKL